jgi:hypothetical protein
MHLTCGLDCGWISSHTEYIQQLVTEYLYHVIKEHWDVLQLAHNNPTALDQAAAILQGEI